MPSRRAMAVPAYWPVMVLIQREKQMAFPQSPFQVVLALPLQSKTAVVANKGVFRE
jgi:hypothetical protein